MRVKIVLAITMILTLFVPVNVSAVSQASAKYPTLTSYFGGFTRILDTSPDNHLLVTTVKDSVVVWNQANLAHIRTFRTDTGWISRIFFSCDSKYVIIVGWEGLSEWDVSTGTCVFQRENDETSHSPDAAVNIDRTELYILLQGHRISRWDIRNTCQRISLIELPAITDLLPNEFSTPNHICSAKGSSEIVLGFMLSTPRIFDLEHSTWVASLDNAPADDPHNNYRGVICLGDSCIGIRENKLIKWSLKTHKVQLTTLISDSYYEAHTMPALSYGCEARDQLVVTNNSEVSVIDRTSLAVIHRFTDSKSDVYAAGFNNDGSALFAVDTLGQLFRYDTRTWSMTAHIQPPQRSLSSADFSPDGQHIACAYVTPDNTGINHVSVDVWNLTTGEERSTTLGIGNWAEVRFAGNQSVLVNYGDYKVIQLSVSGNEINLKRELVIPSGSTVDTQGWQLAAANANLALFKGGNGDAIQSVDIRAWTVKAQRKLPGYIRSIALSKDGSWVAACCEQEAHIMNAMTLSDKIVKQAPTSNQQFMCISFLQNDTKFAVAQNAYPNTGSDLTIWTMAGNQLNTIHTAEYISQISFNSTGNIMASYSHEQSGLQIHNIDLHTDIINKNFPSTEFPITPSFWFTPNNKCLVGTSSENGIAIGSAKTGDTIVQLQSNGSYWLVTSPEGRFQTSNPDLNSPFHWIFDDDPFNPIPPAVFARNYLETRLVPRLLAKSNGDPSLENDFDYIAPLSSLNRVQPEVTVRKVKHNADGTADVTVRVANKGRRYERAKAPLMWSGAKDIRLFRDGQLVGSWPDTKEGGLLLDGGAIKQPKQMTFEYTFNHIQLPWFDPSKRVQLPQFNPSGSVQVPLINPSESVQFTAYAFNTDDVRSEISPAVPCPAAASVPAQPRAYLVCMGVNRFQNPHWKLDFAANDAKKMLGALTPCLKNQFEVVPILLTSEDGQRTPTATKQNLTDILSVLAGKKAATDLTAEQHLLILHASELRRVAPGDLVLLFFSTHGDQDYQSKSLLAADPSGAFYLFPYDIGKDGGKVPPREKCISSNELAYWLRDVDARTVLVVDACHAAGTVGKKFKQAPLGSRGMGQLAYDKGMQVLAATQVDTSALEVNLVQKNLKIQEGLLIYALIDEGLVAGKARSSPGSPITLTDWLAYAVARVPKLQQEMLSGHVSGQAKGAEVRVLTKGPKEITRNIQKPQFYDFTDRLPSSLNIVLSK